ncbi:MAG: pyrimidine operon attenuation protein/uracil phosphoribosyltransferase [Cyclobacteriaceae bacterium]|jgi:pyrimidine operon attenuation protein/uracil phosphoribosyltransferase
MPDNKKLILSNNQVIQIIKRIAYEIYEHNFQESEIVLVGIGGQGVVLAKKISEQLTDIAPDFKHQVVELSINKKDPLAKKVTINVSGDVLKDKSIILIDDVLNSGRTLAYGLNVLMETNLKRIQTAALVDRSHKKFPVVANFKGYELSTTLEQRVEVRLENDPGIFLY